MQYQYWLLFSATYIFTLALAKDSIIHQDSIMHQAM